MSSGDSSLYSLVIKGEVILLLIYIDDVLIISISKNVIKDILEISLLLEYYNKTSNQDKYIKLLKILIYVNYLLCWLYVLIISLPSINIEILFETLNNTWERILEPISETYLTLEIEQ